MPDSRIELPMTMSPFSGSKIEISWRYNEEGRLRKCVISKSKRVSGQLLANYLMGYCDLKAERSLEHFAKGHSFLRETADMILGRAMIADLLKGHGTDDKGGINTSENVSTAKE